MGGCPVQYDPDGHNIGPEDVAVFEVFSRGSEELPDSKALATDVKTLIPFTTLEPLNPIVSPPIVTVNADAPIVAPDVVITTDVAEVAPQVAVSPATLLAPGATVGVTEDAKKPEGYVSVMVPPEEIGKNGETPRMTGTEDCPAMRSDEAMTKNTSVT